MIGHSAILPRQDPKNRHEKGELRLPETQPKKFVPTLVGAMEFDEDAEYGSW
jgi:hypothetical protein